MTCPSCGRVNVDGAQFCANPDCGAYLGWEVPPAGSPDATRRFTGRIPVPGARPVPGGPGPGPGQVPGSADAGAAAPTGAGEQRAGVRASLSDTAVAVEPGGTASATVSVYNTGTQVEGFMVTVTGPAAAWTAAEPVEVSVYPEQAAAVTLRFTPPRDSSCAAGQIRYTVRLDSTVHRGLTVTVDGVAGVAAFRDLGVELVPRSSSGRRSTNHHVVLDNRGNVVERLRLAAFDDEEVLRMRLGRDAVDVPPGQYGVPLRIRPPWRWFGRPRTVPIHATATPGTGPPVRADGTRTLVPVFPSWVPVAALVLLLLAGGSGAVLALASGGGAGPGDGGTATATASLDRTMTPSPTMPSSPASPTVSPTTASPAPSPPDTAVNLPAGTHPIASELTYATTAWCLTILNGSAADKANLVFSPCRGYTYQRFDVEGVKAKVYRLKTHDTGRCLAAGTTGTTGDLYQTACDASALDQQFFFERSDTTPSDYRLRPLSGYGGTPAGRCVGGIGTPIIDGTHVGLVDCDATRTDQLFRVSTKLLIIPSIIGPFPTWVIPTR